MIVRSSDFFVQLQQALNTAFNASTQFSTFEQLSSFLDPAIVDEAFVEAGVATVRKRRLPLEAVMWSVVGMSLFRQESVWHIANKMDIALPGKNPLVAPSAMVQARQRLGVDAVKAVFKKNGTSLVSIPAIRNMEWAKSASSRWCGMAYNRYT